MVIGLAKNLVSSGKRGHCKDTFCRFACVLAALLTAGGCTSRTPTIAHTHIGHAMTGWRHTPDQAGLFVVAEDSAQEAIQAAEDATQPGKNFNSIKQDVTRIIRSTNPEDDPTGAKKDELTHGVKPALVEAVSHIQYAADSADASANVKSSTVQFSQNAIAVLDRCDLISALGIDIVQSTSMEDVTILSGELLRLTRENFYGADSDGDGIIGGTPDEFGLVQLRAELQAMMDREDPPYTTVGRWYLLNLVRLPTGEWIFREWTEEDEY